MKRVVTGCGERTSRCAAEVGGAPLRVNMLCGNGVQHCGTSSEKSPACTSEQYSTSYLVAYGLPHVIRIALIGVGLTKSIAIHCGCASALSCVNASSRYGLLFQYVRTSP